MYFSIFASCEPSIQKTNCIKNTYVNNQSLQGTQNFKTYRNKLHSLIRKAKEYMLKKFEETKGNMKKTWNMINKVINWTS